MTPAAEELEPTRDQLLAMAYCDGELTEAAHREFEARLAHEPELLREVSELKRLEVLSRRVAPREAGDLVRSSLARNPVHSGLTKLAFAALLLGALLSVGCGAWALLTSADLTPMERFLCLSLGGGLALLFGLTLRQRCMLLPHDPYRSVER